MTKCMKKILLLLIILLAFVLRFWNLGAFPALNADEAALGYNAYSLLQTGKDEHGNPWPIHFQSFNDYKPGLYVYLTMPFVAVLGLTEWAVRIPGALAGVGTIWVVYLLVLELARKKSELDKNYNYKSFALLAAFLVAISPWHIHFSRGGWEVNVATFFITAGLLSFLKGLRKQWYLLLSVLMFAFALYTYHAARLIVPLFGLGLLFLYWRELLVVKKGLLVSVLVGGLLLIPLSFDLLGPAGISRAAGVGLFADQGPLNRINEQRGEHGDYTNIYSRLLHNKGVNYGFAFVQNWSEHFYGEFLFMTGDSIQRNKVPETGQLYIFEIVTLFVGLYFISKIISNFQFPVSKWKLETSNFSVDLKKNWLLIMWWLLIAPLPAALTFQSPHALRAQNMVIPLAIISAYGLYTCIRWIANQRFRLLRVTGYGLLSFIILWSFTRYLHQYYVHMTKEYPYSSQYGIKELAAYIQSNDENYQNVIVTTRYDQPYILLLFYMKYPPKNFQAEHVLTNRDQFGFSTVNHFDKYYFQTIDYEVLRTEMPSSLIVGTGEEIPNNENIVKKIYGSNGFEYFNVVAN
jgi:4-amino-4-deoxy-L-arabinose transferase-like glycosyltransferase